jgi:hypothetical protein
LTGLSPIGASVSPVPEHEAIKAICSSNSWWDPDHSEIIRRAWAALREAGLIREELIGRLREGSDGDIEDDSFLVTHLILPDGSAHSVTDVANARNVFEIPALFYACGAGKIWKHPAGPDAISHHALLLYLALCSEHDSLCYGGVNPAVLSRRNGKLVLGGVLTYWVPRLVSSALKELRHWGLVSRRQCTISAIDDSVIRTDFHVCSPDQENVEIVALEHEPPEETL